jgi:hypothetical protein
VKRALAVAAVAFATSVGSGFSRIDLILSTSEDNLWTFELPDGRGMRRALAFMAPYIKDKRRWPFARDVQYFDEWPMRHPTLLFGALALDCPDCLDVWKTLPADSNVEEVVRNFFIRQPVLWVS